MVLTRNKLVSSLNIVTLGSAPCAVGGSGEMEGRETVPLESRRVGTSILHSLMDILKFEGGEGHGKEVEEKNEEKKKTLRSKASPKNR